MMMTATRKLSLARPVMLGEKELIMGLREGLGTVMGIQMEERMSRQSTGFQLTMEI
jgi:hypothetical protein